MPFSEPMDPRIRLDPRSLSPAETAMELEAWKGLGWRTPVSADAEEVLEEVSTASSGSRAQLRTWALYPDERVPLALYRNRRMRRTQGEEEVLENTLMTRGFLCNRREGTLWNPFLEALTLRGENPAAHRWAPSEYLRVLPRFSWRSPREALQELEDNWRRALRQEADGVLLDSMATCRSSLPLSWLASHAQRIPPRLVPRLMRDTNLFAQALDNASMQPGERERLAARVEETLRGLALSIEGRGTQEALVPLLVPSLVSSGLWTQAHAEELLFALFPSTEPEARAPLSLPRESARRALVRMLPQMAEGALRQLYQSARDEVEIARAVISHPATPLEVLRDIAVRHRDVQTRARLAACERAIGDPQVSTALGASRAAVVERRLLEKGTGPAYRKLVLREIEKNPERGLEILSRRQHDAAAMGSLQKTDLAPAFQRPESEVRETALGLLGNLPVTPPEHLRGKSPKRKR